MRDEKNQMKKAAKVGRMISTASKVMARDGQVPARPEKQRGARIGRDLGAAFRARGSASRAPRPVCRGPPRWDCRCRRRRGAARRCRGVSPATWSPFATERAWSAAWLMRPGQLQVDAGRGKDVSDQLHVPAGCRGLRRGDSGRQDTWPAPYRVRAASGSPRRRRQYSLVLRKWSTPSPPVATVLGRQEDEGLLRGSVSA